MKLKVLALAAGLGVSSAVHDDQFEFFKAKFNKSYADEASEAHARMAFHASLDRIALRESKLNPGDEMVFGLTQFSDMTVEDFQVFLGANPPDVPAEAETEVLHFGADTPTSVDWRNANNPTKAPAVTTVKDQGQCGSCWAFSAAETIESSYMLAGNQMYEFSPQQIASCTPSCDGCGGGWTTDAYEQIMTNTGLSSEWFTPYVQSMYEGCMDATCTEKCSIASELPYATEFPFAKISGYKYATPTCTGACADQNIDLLAQSLATKGPTSVCVNAGAWQDYKGGVMSQAACGGYAMGDIDHCVQLVAMTEKTFVIRNSWATTWGEEGFITLERANTCGLANIATHPTIAKSQVKPGAFYPKMEVEELEFIGEQVEAATSHYEDPNAGPCQKGELAIQIQGVKGKMCAPKCAFLTHKCPTDVPAGVTAKPTCALKGGPSKYCALICSPTADVKSLRAGDAQCGTNASCKAISGTGICTYDK